MILVIGGHTRNIGKTTAVERVISCLPDLHWTAIKITQYGHGICSADGKPCACAVEADHPYALIREAHLDTGTDSSRYLAAGASESWWLRTRAGDLANAMPALRRLLTRSTHAVIESNSVLDFLHPDLYIVVLDPSVADFKPSALRHLESAHAVVVSGVLPDSIAPRAARLTMETLEKFVRLHHKVRLQTSR